jgi:hypothetical protein
MIPIPPIQWDRLRHKRMLEGRSSMIGNIVAPVVVNPDTDSNRAPAIDGAIRVVMNGIAPTATIMSHARPTTVRASRALSSECLGVTNHRKSPSRPGIAIARSHASVRPSRMPSAAAGSIARATAIRSPPSR